MDILKKLETLLNATTRARLPRRQRRSALDEFEQEQLSAIRQALAEVESRERDMAERLKTEQTQAAEAEQRGDRAEQRAHEQRAAELERHLQNESIQAINLEEKLAALEENLALAKEAVEKQAKQAALKDEAASQVLAQGSSGPGSATSTSSAVVDEIIKTGFADDQPDVAARKSRLSG